MLQASRRANARFHLVSILVVLALSILALDVQAADGDLDLSFGTGGKVRTGFGVLNSGGVYAMALQSDGKIVVAGTVIVSGNYRWGLVRYDMNGNLDSSFGNGGKILTDVLGGFQEARAIAIQSDGKIVVAGSVIKRNSSGVNVHYFALARYDSNGNLDSTFGSSGIVTTDLNGRGSQALAMSTQPDGRILVAGLTVINAQGMQAFGVVRYNSNGSLDLGFGSGGKITTTIGLSAQAYSIALQSDGKIIVGGLAYPLNFSNIDFALVRYDSNGNLDTSFGTGGKVTTDYNGAGDYLQSLAIQSDGKIVATGSTTVGSLSAPSFDLALARYDEHGILDASFGNSGQTTTDFDGSSNGSQAVALQDDGKILAAGFNGGDFASVRYDTNGNLDTSFGVAGKVTTNLTLPTDSHGTDCAFAISVQSDGKIVLAGMSGNDFALARYNGTPVAQPTPTPTPTPSPTPTQAPPVAVACCDQSFRTWNTVITLDGSGSFDPGGQPLTYSWRLVSQPFAAVVNEPAGWSFGEVTFDSSAVQPTVTLSQLGTYKFSLIVNNGQATSAPAFITITFSGFNNLPRRSPSDLFRWDPVRGVFVIDYGSGPGTPGEMIGTDSPGFCQIAREIFGDEPVSVTIDANGNFVANSDDVLRLQSALPDDYKWIGLAAVTLCNGIRIEPPKIDCPTMREYFILLTGRSLEDMLIDELPLSSDFKEFLRPRLNVCTGLNLDGLTCTEIIDLAAELSSVFMPQIGQLLNSPIGKFIAKAILCEGIDITLPDIDVSFPDVDFGFGGSCWLGCGGEDSPSGGGGGSPGQPPYWFPVPDGQPPYDCSLVPVDWATITWGDLRNRAAAAGVDVPTLLNSIIACMSPEPILGFPHQVEAPNIDSTPPTIIAPADSSASADDSCQVAVPDYIAGSTATDDSGSVTLSQSPAAGTLVGLGAHTVTVTAVDGSGNSSSDTVVFTVNDDTPPILTSTPGNIVTNTDAGQCAAVVTFSLPAATDNCSTATVASSPASGSVFPTGTTTVSVTAIDAAGNTTSHSFTVTVNDQENPTIACPANINVQDNVPGSCGASVNPGTPVTSDNCGIASAVGTRSDGQTLTALYPVGSTTINWVVTDASGNTASCLQTITVTNPAPLVNITGPPSGSLYGVNTPINFTGSFTDNAGDTHSAVWTFEGTPQAGIVDETTHTVSASHTFDSAGVYLVTLTVTDDCGQTSTTNQVGGFDALVVIYDPDAGFVTGGGWINSPAGAYAPNPSLVGKANFGFVSRYQRGANIPDGQTEFQFKVANLNFHSTVYEWLVVAGARAQYKGSGTINGMGNYGFMLTAIDGDISGGGGIDKFRIKIWDKNNGDAVLYDNQMGAGIDDDPATALGGGSIVIHKKTPLPLS